MRLILVVLFGLFITVLLTGCNSQPVNPSPPSPQPSAIPVQTISQSWLVNLKVTGGFAGIQRIIEISSNGNLRVIDDRSGKEVTRSIPAPDLAKISGLIAEIVQVNNEIVPPCADCFVYEIFIRRDNSMFSTVLNDVNLDESGVSDLINLLMTWGNDALGY